MNFEINMYDQPHEVMISEAEIKARVKEIAADLTGIIQSAGGRSGERPCHRSGG